MRGSKQEALATGGLGSFEIEIARTKPRKKPPKTETIPFFRVLAYMEA